ncbi:hypothetical protein PR202_ga17174 [Eleusine coracana subsp. coracana]|uniref:PGG domain-containing protein n=1 Tax=Eleusine coracana subsp. coracana TaxID=191504 RepID=A0AAV5CPA9_ELECO|nr:hypothetical protein PR202_ga17174 [Eleusine coracana subsp. coracana]
MNLPFKGILRDLDDDSAEAQRRKWFKEMQGWLMVLTTVAASVTYQAGLNPPGGFWQDDPRDKSHHAGDPALHDEHHSRYMIFYYFNATAFVTSLVIMVLLMSERFYHTEDKVLALLLATIVDLASLIGAYIAGTTRYFSSCIYIIVITCVAFVAVIYIGDGDNAHKMLTGRHKATAIAKMSQQQINEEQEARNVSVVQVAPGDAAPVITKTNGRSGIPVLIAPFHGQSGGGASGGSTTQEMTMAFKGLLLLEEEDDDDPEIQRKKWFKEMRGWLMVLATVAASVTYQAGLNPPGGVWQDNAPNGSHHAGDPVLRDEHHARYLTFFYFNATAFVTSLVIMVLLMSERFYYTEGKVFALFLTTIVDLASLIGAYIAGSTRYFSSCIYIIVITSVAFVAVIYIGEYAPSSTTLFPTAFNS